jgi:hypothetical protein
MHQIRSIRAPRSHTSNRRRPAQRARISSWLESLETRVMLDATPTLPVGAASIFTQLPPEPEGATQNFLTPSNETAVLDNLVYLNAASNPTPLDVGNVTTLPNVAPNSPAASMPVASTQTWSSVYSRNPSEPAYLTNSQAYILVDANGNPITSGTGNLESYAQYYARLGETPPAPNAPFFGKNIVVTTTNGVTTYQYSTVAPARIGFPYAPNASNPVSFGDLSFSTNLTLNNTQDPTTNFGNANTPFSSTPGTLFTLTSTARYLDYRTGVGPNGSTPVTVQEMDSSGQFQTVPSNGLIPYFDYDLPTKTPGTNDFSSPNFGDLGVSMMDLGGSIAGPYSNPTGVDANDLQLWDYSDDAATVTWGNATLGNFQVTMSESSPFAQFTYTRGTDANPLTLLLRNNDIPGLNPLTSTATYDPTTNSILITGYAKPDETGMNVVQDPNVLVKVFYAIYLPTGITINPSTYQSNIDGTTYLPNNPTPQVPLFGAGANDVLVSLPSQDGTAANPFHFVIASLPNPDEATIAAFRNYAFNYIAGSTNTLTFNPSTNQVGLTISVTTQNVDAQSTAMGALLEIFPIQYDNLPNSYNSDYLTDSSPGLPSGTYLTLSTDFGNTRLMAAPTISNAGGTDTSSISYSMTYNGSLSLLPQGAFVSTDPNDSPTVTPDELSQEVQLIQGLLTNYNANALLTNNGQGNTYVWGQELQKLATLIPVADQLGMTAERNMLLQLVESEMTQWFNAANTLNSNAGQMLGYDPHLGVPQFFYYDSTWDALIGYNAGFGADTGLNDFAYQIGYWIQAAAVVATYDPTFISGYGPMVTMLAQNVDNWNRSDTMFPYLRSFDAYAGHSWAAGVSAVGSGQNEESISEIINFESGMIAWGNALIANAQSTSDPNYTLGMAIRNTGIELQTFETASYDEYYLNANNDTFPPLTIVSYGGNTYGAAGYLQLASYQANPTSYSAWKPEIYASNQFTMQRGTTTFFVSNDKTTGNNPEIHYAISILPISPSSLYLGADPSLVEANYNNYIAQQNAVYGNPVPGQARALPISYPAETYVYQALFNPTAALNRWNGIGGYEYDYPANTPPAQLAQDSYTNPNYKFQATLDTPAATYYFLQYFNKYGQVDGSVHALNATQTAVMTQTPAGSSTTDTTYIVENLPSTPLAAVNFSDGYTVANVPAHAVYAVTVDRSIATGAIVTTVTNTYVIPNLSTASAGPPPGGGTNLFLGYSLPAAPQTQTTEPLTLQPQTNPGMVAITNYVANAANTVYQYTYGTPDVFGPDPYDPNKVPLFAGAALPDTNIVSFQLQHVTGTYDPSLDTQFQLYFKAPLGLDKTNLQAVVQVSYQYTLPDGQLSNYVETYPKTELAGIGGLVVLTNQALGVIGAVLPLGSGVAAATHTVGTGTIDPNLHFDVFQPNNGQNQNLLYPSYYPGVDPNAQLFNRTVQLSPQPFTMMNGTVTFTVFIARFSNNGTAQYADPQLELFAGLPGYAGYRSFVTIPFTNVKVGPLGTSALLTSLAPNAIVDNNLDSIALTTDVTSNGVPINEGEVQFFENGTILLGFAPVLQGMASLTLTQPLGLGNDAITAVYSDPAGGFDSTATPADIVEVDGVKVGKSGIRVVQPDGATLFHVDPFGSSDHKGLNVAGLDLNGGAEPLLVVAPRRGEKPRVRIYDAVTGKAIRSFLAYPRSDRGGVSLATVAFNGSDEIVTAAGRGARPVVKVFDAFTGRPLLHFLAFDRRDRNGTVVSAAPTSDGSGFTITAHTTWKGRTLTRMFNGTTGAQVGATLVTPHKAK